MTIDTKNIKPRAYTSTRNACKLCNPLGACVAFKGIEGCLPLIHGSQGCATYIRRYMISHYREPVDIASSSFSEESAIFGGNKNFNAGIENIIAQYNPKVVAISSTCLSETIGEDVPQLIKEFKQLHKGEDLPVFVNASTPSYQGSHIDGFHEAVKSIVMALAVEGKTQKCINIFPGFVSTEDLRELKDIIDDFGLKYNMVPDYSDSLDNPNWQEYTRLPEGGTPLENIRLTGQALASVELGYTFNKGNLPGRVKNNAEVSTAGEFLSKKFNVVNYQTGLPIGIKESDKFFKVLETISGKETPDRYKKQRGRLIDSYVDGHKYVFGKRAVVYGEEDLVTGLVSFLNEIGVEVVMAVSGGESKTMEESLRAILGERLDSVKIGSGMDFEDINDMTKELKPDFFIGNSKAYYITKKLGIPLVRVGFPIHDRMGAQRVQHLSYRGTQQLFDRVCNAIMERKQEKSDVGFKYL